MNRFITSLILLLTSWVTAMSQVTEIDDIWDIKYNNRPMVIEAYANWCAPCRAYKPIFDRVAREYQDRIDFYRMDIDGPDAHNFMEINSVPTTIFLWEPQGDATVKHSSESGLLRYDELKQYVENALAKHYTNKPKPTTPTGTVDYSSTKVPSSWPELPREGVGRLYTVPEITNYLGRWVASDNGFESILEFKPHPDFPNSTTVYAGTMSPQRFAVFNTPNWWLQAVRWDSETNSLFMIDVIPTFPQSWDNNSSIEKGIYRELYLRVIGETIHAEVTEYIDWNGWNNNLKSNYYTITYNKVI